ncbi:hypothetical protein, partial [Salmonella enterica]|uniref:hypothetical protein n=1 Tax=Salmonella enterica TaxID=28901 RepID=UPI003CED73CA
VIVKGEANMVVRFAQCCSPLPGFGGASISFRDGGPADLILAYRARHPYSEAIRNPALRR